MARTARSTVLLTLLVALAATARAEVSARAVPQRAILPEKAATVPTLALAPLDRDFLTFQDEIAGSKERGRPARVGTVETVHVTPQTDGVWTAIDGDRWVWRLRVSAPGSLSLGFGFERFRMPEGGSLSIYAADGSRWLRPLTSDGNRPNGRLWTAHLGSDDVILEVVVPAAERARLELELTSIQRAYRSLVGGPATATAPEKSGACNVDVVCAEGDPWREQIRSVAWYTVQAGSSLFFCTGALINNTAQNLTSYFLTAFHCFDSDEDDVAEPELADTLNVYWKHESPTCRTPGSPESGGDGDGPDDAFTQSGATYRAGFVNSDFALLELDDAPQPTFDAYWSGWNRAATVPPNAVAIHHPFGSPPRHNEKRISFENDPLAADSWPGGPTGTDHLRINDWDLGTTEGGSSGGPLFDPNHRIIGQLHGGFALCNNNLEDWFGRFFSSWTGGGTTATRLQDWLDPGNTGATTLDGTDEAGQGPPAAPSNLTAAALSSTQVQLQWNDNATNEDDYRIQFKTGSDSFQFVPGTLPPNTTSATVTGLTPQTTYTFRVRARNEEGNADSNTADATTPASGACVDHENNLCLGGGRFLVQTTWRTAEGATGAGVRGTLTDDTGYFWFFGETNVELVVKVLNACSDATGNRYWVFAGGLTNVEVQITVTDLERGNVKTYTNPLNKPFQPIQDTDAFATCP